MSIVTTTRVHTPTGIPARFMPSGLSRTDPANIDQPITEPIDISAMIQLLLDRD